MEPPSTRLPVRSIEPDDGWCDDPDNPAYNRAVKLPLEAGHERLWRDDRLYDGLIVLGYNTDPPVAGLGSAIFLHIAKPDYGPTEGCVAVSPGDFRALVASCGPESSVDIQPPSDD